MSGKKSFLRREGPAVAKIAVGSLIYALSVVLFIDPAHIIPGSVTGIGVVVKALTGFPIGVLSILINVPLVIWATVVLGKRVLIYTGLTVLLTYGLTDLLAFLPPFTDDVLLASVFGGVVMGVGLGLILDAGGTTGGTTVVGRLVLHKRPNIPIGNILMIGDFIIIVAGSLLLRDWDLLLYSLVDLYVCVVVINKIMYDGKKRSLSVLRTAKSGELLRNLRDRIRCSALYCGADTLVVISRKRDVSALQQVAETLDGSVSCASFDAEYSFGDTES